MMTKENSPDQQEARMKKMAEGRQSAVLLGLLGPYLNNKVSEIVSGIAISYRNKTTDYNSLLGSAAQITLCLDIMADLEGHIRQAERATKEELDGQKARG